MSLLKNLEKFNLSTSEAKVYVACLELGPEAVQKIAARAKLNRVSAYSVIETLITKGFLREEIIKNKRRISASPPMKLYDIIGQRQEHLKRQEHLLETLVPELKSITKRGDSSKPNIIYYEGAEGLKNWATDVLSAKGELLEWTRIEAFVKPFEEYLDAVYFPEKFKRQIPTRFLFIDTPEARAYARDRYLANPAAAPMKARFVPPEHFPAHACMVIYNDRFTIAFPPENKAIVVVDPIVTDFQRSIFEFGWQNATGEIAHKPYPHEKAKTKK